MPGCVLFRRKWLLSSDVLLFPFLAESVIRILLAITASVMIWVHYKYDYECKAATTVKHLLFMSLVDIIFNLHLSAAIIWLSARGSVMQEEKRRWLPVVLYMKFSALPIDLLLAGFGVWFRFFNEGSCTCSRPEVIVYIEVAVACAILYFLTVCLVLVLSYDPLGSLKFLQYNENHESAVPLELLKKAEKTWSLRLKMSCCCIGFKEVNHSIYNEIATFLASLFKNFDLVPSDIVAGLFILSKKHASEKKRMKFMDTLCSYEYLSKTDASLPSWMTVENALYYLRISKSAYGWPILIGSCNPFKLCSVLSHIRCKCIQSENVAVHDDCCYCNIAALKRVTGFSSEEIIYFSYHNTIYQPSFFVAVDQQKSSIIVCIRGTLSLSDLVTDLDAERELMNTGGHVPEYFCHRGTLRSAQFIYDRLEHLNVLKIALMEHPDFSLVITGHSLGGTIAGALGIMLRPRYSNVRCFIYGPLASISSEAIKMTYDFMLTVVVGDDMSPRFSSNTCKELLLEVIKCLEQCKLPKYKILAEACLSFLCGKPIKALDHPDEGGIFASNAVSGGEPNGASGTENRLYTPGRILYLEKTANGVQSLWKTGFHFQRVIVSPRMFSDHQPHTIQQLLEEVNEEYSVTSAHNVQSFSSTSETVDHSSYSHQVDISDECGAEGHVL